MSTAAQDFITEAKYDEVASISIISNGIHWPVARLDFGVIGMLENKLKTKEDLATILGHFIAAAINEKIEREKGECSLCKGRGFYINEDHPKYPDKQQKLDCEYCDGTGKAQREKGERESFNRVEVINHNPHEKEHGMGRTFVSWRGDNHIYTQVQDQGKTLKVFIEEKTNHNTPK